MDTSPPDAHDLEALEALTTAHRQLVEEIGKRVVGQHQVVEHLLIALFSQGHTLFVGVPGLAKTLLISTLAEALDLSFNRIQFTPDLMPSDITGTDVLDDDRATGRRVPRFVQGPIFANVILADEINRTPPKTQAALLQAMQEHRVTAGGQTYHLPQPFFVFATQNPIEQEGTYPLPEAQLDRFMFLIDVGYPSVDEEVLLVQRTTGGTQTPLKRVLNPDRILSLQELVKRVPVPDNVVRFAVDLARQTRPNEGSQVEMVRRYVNWGAGPRASQFLVVAAKARAVLSGRFSATVDDVRTVAVPILQHRLVVNFAAEAEGISAKSIAEHIASRGR